MADYVSTTISIGGTVTEEVADELIELLESFSGTEREDGKPLVVQDEFAGGTPDEIVAFCKEHGLHLWYHHDAKYDIDAAIHVYDPVTRQERECASNTDYQPLIGADELAKFATVADALAHLASFADNTPPFEIAP